MTATDPALLSATECLALYRRRRLSPAEVVAACLARVERLDGGVNAFCLVDGEAAMAAARAAEARWMKGAPLGPVDGVPATIKDLFVSAGWPTLRGSRTVDPAGPWTEDAPAVARLRESGAVFLGKTTTPEFGWKGLTDGPLTGITRNPWNRQRTPGGSSGGAAVAAALGMGALHLGTDGGGSIRIPAGFTGVFGIKPSFGRVPAHPPSVMGTLSHCGPITRTVADAALMLKVIAGPDERDPLALPPDPRDYRIGLEDGLAGLKIAYSPRLGGPAIHPEVAAAVVGAVETLADLGAEVTEAEPDLGDALPLFYTHWYAGAARLVDGIPADRHAEMDPGLLAAAERGRRIGIVEYGKAQAARIELSRRAKAFLSRYDLLVTPTLPLPAFEAGILLPAPGIPGWPAMTDWADWSPFSVPFNLTQQPACSIPCGFSSDGLPIGLQIVGPHHADGLVLRAARAFESARPIRLPPT
ncbi:MAG: amidase [Thalassobaculales bacterium]